MWKLITLSLLLQLFPGPPRYDINTVAKASLVRLESVTPEIADAIIKGRPYKTVEDLKDRIPKEVYEKIKDRLYVPSRRLR